MGYTLNPFTGQFDITGGSGGGGSSPSIGGPVTGGTDKSVLFISPANTLSQDNPDFTYDSTLNLLNVAGSVVTPSLVANSLDRGSAGTLAIGTSVNSSIINIGNAGATINMIGTTLYENVTVLNVANPIINLNVGGGVGSGSNSGLNIQENSIVTGYAETSADRNSWIFKAPNTAGIATITPGAGGITLDQSSHDPVTLGTANGLSLSTQVLSLGLSSTSTTGALSSTDWNTFNTGVANAANKSLSNLTTTSINQTLLPDTTDSRNIGSGALRWDAAFIGRLTAPSGNDIILLTTRQLRNTSNSTVLDFSGTDPSLSTHKLTNVVDPTAAQDAATKNYVDTNAGANKTLSNLTSPVAVNQDLLPDASANHRFLGSSSKVWFASAFVEADFFDSSFIQRGAINGSSSPAFVITATSGPLNLRTSNTTITNNISVQTGNASAGNSGDIILQPGTATGTRGKITFQDGSEGTAGQVWTSTDTTGKGAWVAATVGANTALSNLSSVAINTSLLPGSNNTIDLGSDPLNFRDGYIRNLKDGSGGFLSIAVQNRSLNSTSGALVASWATTGVLVLPTGNKLELDGSTSGNIQISAADTTTSYAVKMPNAQGAASTFLQNDGSGNLSWVTATSGVTTIGTIDSQSKSANGAVITGTSLVMQSADATNPGLVTIGAQTFAGAKTFSGNILSSTNGTLDIGSSGNPFNNIYGVNHRVTSGFFDINGLGRWSQSITAPDGNSYDTGIQSSAAKSIAFGTINAANTLAGKVGIYTGNATSTGNSGDIIIQTGTSTATRGVVSINGSAINANTTQIHNVVDPTSAQDAATKNYVDNAVGGVTVPGDISQTSFTAADNQATPANVTGLAFANGVTRSFDALVSIVRSSTYASYKLYGIQKGSSWDLNAAFVGDTTGIVFSITAAGQVQYTSTSTGSTALLKFRAITTSV